METRWKTPLALVSKAVPRVENNRETVSMTKQEGGWMDGQTNKRTNVRKISPFYRTSSPIGAAAQKALRKKGKYLARFGRGGRGRGEVNGGESLDEQMRQRSDRRSNIRAKTCHGKETDLFRSFIEFPYANKTRIGSLASFTPFASEVCMGKR